MHDAPIQYQTEPYAESEILDSLHPFVREWFESTFTSFSPPQTFSILNIKRGINTLISSPTGSGKTLSAFLAILDNLVSLADKGQLDDRVYAIYLSPLKALANDITKNLKEPLKEIGTIAKRNGRHFKIRVATRTGDTTPSQKASMLKKPPHILVTTPESLAISLASSKFSMMLREARYVIIDEIHALADNKRGVHMSLSLEQLEELHAADNDGNPLPETDPLIRIGLSATVRPLEGVAGFLVGMADPVKRIPRPCKIIDVQFLKQLDLKVLSPVTDLINTSHAKRQDALYTLLHDLIQNHRTTLVFTNTRAGTERVVHNLRERYPKHYTGILDAEKEEQKIEREEQQDKQRGNLDEEFTLDDIDLERKRRTKGYIGAHHGSLSKTHRLNIENRLKQGKLKAVVCSTSLELGIDIGYIDLVVLLGSPKGVARGLQRIGRSGHQLHDTAKGRIIVLDRDDLVECAVLLKAAIEKKIDRIHIPANALDVLAQQLYGMAIERKRHIDELYAIVTRAYPYRTLDRATFMEVIDYLSGEYVVLEKRHVYGKIWYDKESGMVGRRGKLARLIYMTNVGTIPDETNIRVKVQDLVIGTITEGFLERLKPGDVFVLGGEAYEFRYTRGLNAYVKTSAGRPPTVPHWISEMLPLSFDLAMEIQRFRQFLDEMFTAKRTRQEIIDYIDAYLYVDANAVEAIYRYFDEQYRYAMIPHRKRILIEHFSEGNRKYAIYHTLYGRRVNDVLSRAVAYAHARMTGRDVEVGVTDNGFFLKSVRAIPAHRMLAMLKPKELDQVMALALEKSQVLRSRFRHCAARALMILRQYKGQKKSVGKQQMSSRLLMNAVKRISEDFPILREARREVLEDLMDIISARKVVAEIQSGAIRIEERAGDLPSPFAFNIVLQAYTDLLKMEDRVAFLKRMHEMVLAEIGGEAGAKQGKRQQMPALEHEFTYDRLWELQEAQRRRKEEDFQGYLHDLLRKANWRARLQPEILESGHSLIDGRENEVREEFWEWLDQLLSGTVPKYWHDDIVKFFTNCRQVRRPRP